MLNSMFIVVNMMSKVFYSFNLKSYSQSYVFSEILLMREILLSGQKSFFRQACDQCKKAQ